MSAVLDRLYALAAKRPDLLFRELPNLENAGYFVNKDGTYYIFIDRSQREYKKTAVLAHELGHYIRRRRDFSPDAPPGPRPPEAEDEADRCSRRLLLFVRLGLNHRAKDS